jgi:hypothetical protein
MERSNHRASAVAHDVRLSTPGRLVDRLLATALVQALTPEVGTGEAADALADLAKGRLRALDEARYQLLRSEDGRPTQVTSSAAAALRLARTVAAGRLRAPQEGEGAGHG